VGSATVSDNVRWLPGVREAREEAGRDPGSTVYGSTLVLCVGRDERGSAAGRPPLGREVAELREQGAAGTPAECLDILGSADGAHAAAALQRSADRPARPLSGSSTGSGCGSWCGYRRGDPAGVGSGPLVVDPTETRR
jgi:hypothetical protein